MLLITLYILSSKSIFEKIACFNLTRYATTLPNAEVLDSAIKNYVVLFTFVVIDGKSSSTSELNLNICMQLL